jgi:hypothetical protein
MGESSRNGMLTATPAFGKLLRKKPRRLIENVEQSLRA